MLRNFLNVLFDSGEEVCVSDNQYAHLSMPLESLYQNKVTLQSQNKAVFPKTVDISAIQLIAINPVKGNREDENCTAFRTFLVEVDNMPLKDQYDYIQSLGMPYSVCVFSGGKSLHFGITLSEDLNSIETYRYLASWILNVASKADKNTKNPSRSIRVPDAIRDGKRQKLLDIKGRVPLEQLNAWLSQFEHLRPAPPKSSYSQPTEKAGLDTLPVWVTIALKNGVSSYAAMNGEGRNSRWFKVFCEFAKRGYSSEEYMGLLDKYFDEEKDFRRPEWETIAKSAEKFKVG